MPVGVLGGVLFGQGMFGESSSSAAPVPGGGGGNRDRDAFNALDTLLTDMGEFAMVPLGDTEDTASLQSAFNVYGKITPFRSNERADVNRYRKIRTVTWSLTLTSRERDPWHGYQALDRLDSTIRNAVQSQTLGFCDPRFTQITDATYDFSNTPDVKLTMIGQFQYTRSVPVEAYDQVE